uniref:Uncharacterized protein n=1 Tax=Anopheles culicifacies TaxID=139723 RepID=A0A182MDI5_9DIPT
MAAGGMEPATVNRSKFPMTQIASITIATIVIDRKVEKRRATTGAGTMWNIADGSEGTGHAVPAASRRRRRQKSRRLHQLSVLTASAVMILLLFPTISDRSYAKALDKPIHNQAPIKCKIPTTPCAGSASFIEAPNK